MIGKTREGTRQALNIFNHHFIDLSGVRIYLERYRNQPILLVNIATEARFLPQITRLQRLHTRFERNGLVTIALPCNDFGEEPRDEPEIGEFLRENYPVSFIVTQRYAVTGREAHPLFRNMIQERGTEMLPTGTFYKYLFDRSGELAEHWAPEVMPDDPALIRAIEQHLGSL